MTSTRKEVLSRIFASQWMAMQGNMVVPFLLWQRFIERAEKELESYSFRELQAGSNGNIAAYEMAFDVIEKGNPE